MKTFRFLAPASRVLGVLGVLGRGGEGSNYVGGGKEIIVWSPCNPTSVCKAASIIKKLEVK